MIMQSEIMQSIFNINGKNIGCSVTEKKSFLSKLLVGTEGKGYFIYWEDPLDKFLGS